MAPKKILVVDNETLLVDMLKLRLEANGYIVDGAYDGFEGLSKVEQMKPDLVILDIGMAKMDGYVMLKKLRQNDQTKDLAVIMLTASGKKKELFEKEGISDFILKPFDTEDFLRRVDKVVGKGTKAK